VRLDLGEIEDVVDQRQQRLAAGAHDLGVLALFRRHLRVEQETGHADHAVERRADFVAHRRQKVALGAAGRLRSNRQLFCTLHSLRQLTIDRLQRCLGLAQVQFGVVAHVGVAQAGRGCAEQGFLDGRPDALVLAIVEADEAPEGALDVHRHHQHRQDILRLQQRALRLGQVAHQAVDAFARSEGAFPVRQRARVGQILQRRVVDLRRHRSCRPFKPLADQPFSAHGVGVVGKDVDAVGGYGLVPASSVRRR
jgi:hypothetical protein